MRHTLNRKFFAVRSCPTVSGSANGVTAYRVVINDAVRVSRIRADAVAQPFMSSKRIFRLRKPIAPRKTAKKFYWILQANLAASALEYPVYVLMLSPKKDMNVFPSSCSAAVE